MPGGNTRTTSFYPPYPLVMERGQGPWLWDVDQRRYVDLFCNGLSLIHGNGHSATRKAVREAMELGFAWSGASCAQIAYAELLQRRIPALESVRFTNSGSEAGMLAVKAARRHTARPYILKAVGAYHGSYPDLEAGLYGQGHLPGRTFVARFNDLATYEQLFADHEAQIAAVVIEPVLVTGRVVAPLPGFLNALEALARRHGALTILDDCLMLRLAMGGSTEKFALHPDLIVLGKFLGGGTPLGAFGGSREIMRIFDPQQPDCIFHGGSFNGNPVGCAAGLATLDALTAKRIAAMDAAALNIRTALTREAEGLGLNVEISGIGSVAGIAFVEDPGRHEDKPAALGLAALFQLACIREGVLLGPGGIVSTSTVHDREAIDFAVKGLCAALRTIAPLMTRERGADYRPDVSSMPAQ